VDCSELSARAEAIHWGGSPGCLRHRPSIQMRSSDTSGVIIIKVMNAKRQRKVSKADGAKIASDEGEDHTHFAKKLGISVDQLTSLTAEHRKNRAWLEAAAEDLKNYCSPQPLVAAPSCRSKRL